MRFGSFAIWTVALADGAVRRLTTSDFFEVSPEWTPDGRHIVYVLADDRWVDHDIMIVPAAGGAARVVASDRGFFDYGTIGTRSTFGAPLVSPDGTSLLFRSTRSGWTNYWMVPVAGGEPQALAAEPADQSDARWSPDGRSVAFVSNRNGTLDLRVVAAGGGTPRVVVPVTSGVVGSPAWSPDSRRIAYTFATSTGASGCQPRRTPRYRSLTGPPTYGTVTCPLHHTRVTLSFRARRIASTAASPSTRTRTRPRSTRAHARTGVKWRRALGGSPESSSTVTRCEARALSRRAGVSGVLIDNEKWMST